jgi:hypothetical protein
VDLDFYAAPGPFTELTSDNSRWSAGWTWIPGVCVERPGEFLTAGEAWTLVRSGQEDPAVFGVFGTENWGPGEIRGNAMRDLASLLHKIEMLPWDVWGPMEDSYTGKTGDDFDLLIDELASACDEHDEPRLRRVYEELTVPASLIC